MWDCRPNIIQNSEPYTDLTEGERGAVNLFNAEQVKRVHDSYRVDDAVDCSYLVKMYLPGWTTVAS